MEDLQDFNAHTDVLTLVLTERFDIKRILYRNVTIFLSALAKFYQFLSQSSFHIVTELWENDKISEQGKHDLKCAIVISCEARLRVLAQKKITS